MSDQTNKSGAVQSAGIVSVLASVLVSVLALVWKIKAHQSVLSFLWVGVFYALALYYMFKGYQRPHGNLVQALIQLVGEVVLIAQHLAVDGSCHVVA